MHTHRIHHIVLSLIAVAAFAGPLAGVAQATPPAASPGPGIAGTAEQGQPLTLTRGTWTGDSTPTVTDQWTYCTSSDATTCIVPISGATGATYALGAGDVGKYLAVVETGNNTDADTMAPAMATSTSNVIGPIVDPPPPVPVSSGPPTISGTAQRGQTLSEDHASWSNAPTGYTYQWMRCDAGGANCTNISGATNQTYALVAADVGKTIVVQETASNAGGPGGVDPSAATAVVAAAIPVSSAGPTITGTTRQGQTLTEAHGSWSNTPTSYTYQWQRCDVNGANCTNISGATNQTYALAAADVGSTIAVLETASNSDGPATASSGFVGPVTGVPVSSGAPTITGTAQQGQTLTDVHANWSNTPTGYTYQWQRCDATGANCTNISGATNQSYVLVAADVTNTIVIRETASNAVGPGVVDPSAATPVVATGLPVSSAGPTITGTTWRDQTLTEVHGTWSNTPTSYTYQWQRCDATGANCTNINGATNQSYVLVAADVGNTIVVQETATNAIGPAAAAATSAPTSVITLPPPAVIAAPSISGTAQQGITLTEKAARWSNSPTSIAIQWYRCDSNGLTCTAVGTGATYTLTADDRGALMQVSETASNASNIQVIAVSPYAGPVADPAGHVDPPAVKNGSQPAISGTAELGRTLTASRAGFDGNPGQYDDQWMRCNTSACQKIAGATDLSYTPGGADVGNTIEFSETASNSGGTSGAVLSPRTDTITAPSTTALQTSSQAPVAGQTVTLIATVSSPAGSILPAGTVTFNATGGAIAGCVGLTLGTAAPTAVCQTSFPASATNVTAVFSADRGTFVLGSSSSPTTLTVGRAATTLTVAPSGHVSLGSRSTYTAVVHPPASSLTPTGRVTFTDGGKTIKGCGNRAVSAKRASCSVKYLGIKAHRISARYSGDANFAPSASITSHVLVQPQTPKGFVTVYMNWTFGFGPHSTTIKALSASGISPGIGISLTCSGSGCPFKHHKLVVKSHGKCAATAKKKKKKCAAPSSVDLTPMFASAHLRIRTTFTVAITHANWVGKYYRFAIRSGRLPSITESCLAVNGTRPGVGCRAK